MRILLMIVALFMTGLFFSQPTFSNIHQLVGCAPVTKSSPQECMRYRVCCRGVCSRGTRGMAISVCMGECYRRYQACLRGDVSRNR